MLQSLNPTDMVLDRLTDREFAREWLKAQDEAIEQAVVAERERCARVADDRAAQAEAICNATDSVARCEHHDTRKREARRIAALIRHGEVAARGRRKTPDL